MRLSRHCCDQARAKGFDTSEVLAAATDPDITYASGPKYPGQERRIRGRLCAVIAADRVTVVTVYLHCERTALRPDQRRSA